MRNLLLALLLLFFNYSIQAQFSETIRTDRPGNAITPFGVGKNIFQIQSGFDHSSNNRNNRLAYNSRLNNTLVRIGIGENWDLNTQWEYRINKFDAGPKLNGFSLSAFGFRNNFYAGDGLIPALGVQVNLKANFFDDDFASAHPAPQIIIVTQQSLSDKFSFTSNWGLDYNGNDAQPSALYVLNIGYSINDKFSTYIESYGSFGFENDLYMNYDAGLGYLINNNLQLDLYSGMSQDPNFDDYFVSLGISWRTNLKSE